MWPNECFGFSKVDDVKTLVTNSVSVNSTPPLDQEVGSWVSAKGRDLLVSANDVDASGMPLTQAPHTQAVIDARMDAWVGGASVAGDVANGGATCRLTGYMTKVIHTPPKACASLPPKGVCGACASHNDDM